MPDPHSIERDRLLNDLSSSFTPGTRDGVEPPPPPPAIPDHELVRCIGRGSYGEVWLARSILGPWRAVKIVHRRSFDHDRPFERELEGIRKFEPVSRSHPSQLNILHVGRNDTAGCFYYVMELADDAASGLPAALQDAKPAGSAPRLEGDGRLGTRVTRPSDGGGERAMDVSAYTPRTLRADLLRRGRLPFEECLQIGLALATALDHLHRHGLVHRDIKPSNIIFVKGIPKLADIGLVAEAEATLSLVGTEGYLPPEGPGTPQADLFSLGKVLYEMATGRDRQEYPELPTRLMEFPPAEREGLAELNEIIVRACHADLRQRYATAAELHADLALLQSGRSVSRMRAVERRVRIAQRVGVVAVVAALVAASLYAWQAGQTRAMRELALAKGRLAEENARLAEENRQVARFLADMLEGVGPSVALGRDTTLLREILQRTEARLSMALQGQPAVEAELRTTLGGVYRQLGAYEQSEAMLRRAVALEERLHGNGLRLADALMDLALTLQGYLSRAEVEVWHRMLSPDNDARLAEAQRLVEQSLQLRRGFRKEDSSGIAVTLGRLSSLAYDRGDLARAESLAREALAMLQSILPGDHPEVISLKLGLAVTLGDIGAFSEAERLYEEVLAAQKRALGENHPAVSASLSSLALLMQRQGRLVEAESFYREAIGIERSLARPEHPLALGRLLNAISEVFRQQGKPSEAETALRESLPLKIRLYGEEHLEVAAVLDNLGRILTDQGRFDEAEALCQRALAMRRKVAGEAHPHLAISWMGMASLRERQGRLQEAEEALREALAIELKLDRPERPFVPELAGSSRTVLLLNHLARNLQAQSRTVEAEASLRQALGHLREPTPWGPAPKTPTLGLILHHLAEACCALEKCNEARALSEEAVELYRLHRDWPAEERSHAYEVYLNTLARLGDPGTAERIYPEAIAAERSRDGGSRALVARYLGDLAAHYQTSGRRVEAETAFREGLEELRKAPESGANKELRALILHHLADVLRQRNSLEEARSLAEESMALYRRHLDWPAGERQHARSVLKEILVAAGDLEGAESICRERLRDARAVGPEDSPEIAVALSECALVLLASHKYPEAEAMAREGWMIRRKHIPEDWRTFNSQGLVGAALLGRKQYAEAAPLLLGAYEGMKQREGSIPPQGKLRLHEAALRLVQLYEETDQPQEAARWRKLLTGK